MLLFIVVVACSVALRMLLADRPRAALRVRWLWMPFVAAGLQIGLNLAVLRRVVGDARPEVVMASYAIVGAWLIGNAVNQAPTLRFPAGLISFGWMLNVIPIIANRGMPVSRAALADLGVKRPTPATGNLFKHVIATSHTALPFLGDVIPIPVPVLRNVVSVGDLVVFLGVALAIQYCSGIPALASWFRPVPVAMRTPTAP